MNLGFSGPMEHNGEVVEKERGRREVLRHLKRLRAPIEPRDAEGGISNWTCAGEVCAAECPPFWCSGC